MCQLISFFYHRYIGQDNVRVSNLISHHETKVKLRLGSEWYEGHYTGDRIVCRTPKGRDKAMEAVIWDRWPRMEDMLQWALDRGVDTEARDEEDWTLLIYAAGFGHVECVKVLLDAGADTEAQDKYGRTPLMYAAGDGYPKCLRMLLEAGVDKNTQDEDGRTALIHATVCGHVECVKVLLEAGADKNVQDKGVQTALMHAKHYNHLECAELLA